MIRILRGESEVPFDALKDRTAAVVGYGNQGRAHALNMRDSGVQMVVGARQGPGADQAQLDGFEVRSISNAVAESDLVIIALPDESQPQVLADDVLSHIRAGSTLGFLHGFVVHFELMPPPPAGVGIVLVAPKGPGSTLRDRFTQGQGIPCLMAVERESAGNDARALALAWAHAIGCGRAGVICTSFGDETETDLFGEQAVLCGGMTALMLAAFETLVDAGYPPELAYLECCHEVKQVADLLYQEGIAGMMRKISNTAEFGAYVAGPAMIDPTMRDKLARLLKDVRDGAFAQRLQDDYKQGFPWFASQRKRLADHPVGRAGDTVRSLMPWLNAPSMDTPDATHDSR